MSRTVEDVKNSPKAGDAVMFGESSDTYRVLAVADDHVGYKHYGKGRYWMPLAAWRRMLDLERAVSLVQTAPPVPEATRPAPEATTPPGARQGPQTGKATRTVEQVILRPRPGDVIELRCRCGRPACVGPMRVVVDGVLLGFVLSTAEPGGPGLHTLKTWGHILTRPYVTVAVVADGKEGP